MTIRGRSTYDVYCDADVYCMAVLEDIDDTVADPIAAGWVAFSATHLDPDRFSGAEVHLCPKHRDGASPETHPPM